MSQLNPEDERQTRRVGFGVILASISILFEVGAVVLRTSSVPWWAWLLPFISAFVIGAVAVALWVTVYRELRRQMPR